MTYGTISVNNSSKEDNQYYGIFKKQPVRFERLFDYFSRFATVEMSNYFKTRIEFNPVEMIVDNFNNLIHTVCVPSVINIIKVSPFNCNFINILHPGFVFDMVDICYGNWRPGGTKIEGREFTSIESFLFRDSCEIINYSLRKALLDIFKYIEFVKDRFEINRDFVHDIDGNQDCFMIKFDVEFDVYLTSLNMILPTTPFIPVVSLLENFSDMKVVSIDDKEYEKFLVRSSNYESDFDSKFRSFSYKRETYFQNLLEFTPEQMSSILRNDHPQTIALIMSFLPAEYCAKFILCMPAGARSEVINRMRHIHVRQPKLLEHIEHLFRSFSRTIMYDELDKDVEVMNEIEKICPESKKEILEDLKEYGYIK